MDTSVWGPHVWRAIHLIALASPSGPDMTAQHAGAYRRFFVDMGSVLPCAVCSTNYARHLTESSFESALDSAITEQQRVPGSDALFAWTVALHNEVNRSLGKPRSDWKVDEARVALYRDAHECRRVCRGWGGPRLFVVVVVSTLAALLVAAILVAVFVLRGRG